MDSKEFDFEAFKKEAIAGMYAGKPLNGEQGILMASAWDILC